MQRREFLKILSLLPCAVSVFSGKTFASASGEVAFPAIPILMFYRVIDEPTLPEDISTDQLTSLLAHAWSLGYYPVNMSDILLGRVDSVVPAGLIPLGITCDAAHPSILFSKNTVPQGSDMGLLNNQRSFVEIFAESLQDIGVPRATFFLSIGANHATSSYFGNVMPLKDIAEVLQIMPHIEFAYQTLAFTSMTQFGAEQVKAVIQMQDDNLRQLNMLEKVSKIIAYPYGGTPDIEGIEALKELGFLGGVLTFPGVGEAHYESIPLCFYDGRLMIDAFYIPRVAIGSHSYAQGLLPLPNPPIDPLEDFRKDVIEGVPLHYISRGSA